MMIRKKSIYKWIFKKHIWAVSDLETRGSPLSPVKSVIKRWHKMSHVIFVFLGTPIYTVYCSDWLNNIQTAKQQHFWNEWRVLRDLFCIRMLREGLQTTQVVLHWTESRDPFMGWKCISHIDMSGGIYATQWQGFKCILHIVVYFWYIVVVKVCFQ